MTSETPCLNACDSKPPGVGYHAPNCPNAKPAPPQERLLKPCHICGQEQSRHIGAYNACPAPPQDAEPGIDHEAATRFASWALKAPTQSAEIIGYTTRAVVEQTDQLARAYLALRDRLAAIEAQAEDEWGDLICDTVCTVCDGAGCPDCCQECEGKGCAKCEKERAR